jgi:hypothetical protein
VRLLKAYQVLSRKIMADMHDSGVYVFNAWKRGAPHIVRWLGEFNPEMSIDEVLRRLDYLGKVSEHGIEAFSRGWNGQSRVRSGLVATR